MQHERRLQGPAVDPDRSSWGKTCTASPAKVQVARQDAEEVVPSQLARHDLGERLVAPCELYKISFRSPVRATHLLNRARGATPCPRTGPGCPRTASARRTRRCPTGAARAREYVRQPLQRAVEQALLCIASTPSGRCGRAGSSPRAAGWPRPRAGPSRQSPSSSTRPSSATVFRGHARPERRRVRQAIRRGEGPARVRRFTGRGALLVPGAHLARVQDAAGVGPALKPSCAKSVCFMPRPRAPRCGG